MYTALAANMQGHWRSNCPTSLDTPTQLEQSAVPPALPTTGPVEDIIQSTVLTKVGHMEATYAVGAAPPTKAKGTGRGPKVYMQLTGPKGRVYLVEEGDLGKLQTLSGGLMVVGFVGLATDKIPSTAPLNKEEWEG
ncbi:hypothetical protein H2248_011385 [Termitomyces sp. 'cryptogamus']|nr:hypothetical protein H2248_011385 [Termitomyces sp. 'cryptogamus']